MRSSRRRVSRRSGSRRSGRLGQRRALAGRRLPSRHPAGRRLRRRGTAGDGGEPVRPRSGAADGSDSAPDPPPTLALALDAGGHDEPERRQPVGRRQLPALHQLPESAAEG